MEQVAEFAGWFMVSAFAFSFGLAVLTGVAVLIRCAWRS